LFRLLGQAAGGSGDGARNLVSLADDPPDVAQAPELAAPSDSAASPQAAARLPDPAQGDLGASAIDGLKAAREPCPACGGGHIRTLFSATDRLYRTTSKTFQIVECGKCRLIRLSPRPSPIELRDYYPPDYWFLPDETAADRIEQAYRRFVLCDHLKFVERAPPGWWAPGVGL